MLRTILKMLVMASAFNLALATTGLGQGAEILNNATIIELQKLGLGEGVIAEKIKSTKGTYDISINGLKELKAAGVSDEIIRAMIATTSTGQVAGGQVAAGDVNNPSAPHEAGIWLLDDSSGSPKMTLLEPSVYSQMKSGVAFFAAYGQSANSEAIIRGPRSNTRTGHRRPTFYFYFEKAQAGLSESRDVTSANEFILSQFKVDEKKGTRRLVVGSFNLYGGSKAGPDEKSVRPFDFEKVSPGVYKVTPKEDLASGEYGFFYGGTASIGPFVVSTVNGGKIFDFGVDGSASTEPAPAKGKKRK